jgi:hypothetical protein
MLQCNKIPFDAAHSIMLFTALASGPDTCVPLNSGPQIFQKSKGRQKNSRRQNGEMEQVPH